MAPHSSTLAWKSHGWRSLVGCSPWGHKELARLSDFTFTFHFHALEKEMATHSSVLAWRIPGMGEPGGLPSMRSHRVGHNWSDLAAAAAAAYFLMLSDIVLFVPPGRQAMPVVQLQLSKCCIAACKILLCFITREKAWCKSSYKIYGKGLWETLIVSR